MQLQSSSCLVLPAAHCERQKKTIQVAKFPAFSPTSQTVNFQSSTMADYFQPSDHNQQVLLAYGWFVLMRTVPFAHVHTSMHICDVRDMFYNQKENMPSFLCPVEHAFSGSCPQAAFVCTLVCVAGLGNWESHATHMSRDNTRSEAEIGEQWSSVRSTRDNTPIIKGCQNDSNQPPGQTSLCFSQWTRLKKNLRYSWI